MKDETMKETKVTYTLEKDGKFYIIENVPARVCVETGEQFFVDTHNRDFRNRFGELADARDSALRGIFDKAGVDVLELATEDDVTDALLHFADLRKQSLRRSA